MANDMCRGPEPLYPLFGPGARGKRPPHLRFAPVSDEASAAQAEAFAAAVARGDPAVVEEPFPRATRAIECEGNARDAVWGEVVNVCQADTAAEAAEAFARVHARPGEGAKEEEVAMLLSAAVYRGIPQILRAAVGAVGKAALTPRRFDWRLLSPWFRAVMAGRPALLALMVDERLFDLSAAGAEALLALAVAFEGFGVERARLTACVLLDRLERLPEPLPARVSAGGMRRALGSPEAWVAGSAEARVDALAACGVRLDARLGEGPAAASALHVLASAGAGEFADESVVRAFEAIASCHGLRALSPPHGPEAAELMLAAWRLSPNRSRAEACALALRARGVAVDLVDVLRGGRIAPVAQCLAEFVAGGDSVSLSRAAVSAAALSAGLTEAVAALCGALFAEPATEGRGRAAAARMLAAEAARAVRAGGYRGLCAAKDAHAALVVLQPSRENLANFSSVSIRLFLAARSDPSAPSADALRASDLRAATLAATACAGMAPGWAHAHEVLMLSLSHEGHGREAALAGEVATSSLFAGASGSEGLGRVRSLASKMAAKSAREGPGPSVDVATVAARTIAGEPECAARDGLRAPFQPLSSGPAAHVLAAARLTPRAACLAPWARRVRCYAAIYHGAAAYVCARGVASESARAYCARAAQVVAGAYEELGIPDEFFLRFGATLVPHAPPRLLRRLADERRLRTEAATMRECPLPV